MRQVEIYNIKLGNIKIFLAVAEFGSFTVAAEKLHLTQPFVSKAVARLEEELGLYLFIRGSHKFQITPAGRKLYESWKDIIEQFELSISGAHSVQSGMTDELHIGTGDLCSDDNIIVRKVKEFQRSSPGTETYLIYDNMTVLLDRLIKGNIDLILISKHMLPMVKSANLCWRTVYSSHLSVYVHRNNPLYKKECLNFFDLRQERFIVFSPETDESYMELLNELAREAGFKPEISCYIPNAISFKVNLELGKGVALADNFCSLEDENIKRFDLDRRNDIIAVWREDHYRESIKKFCDTFEYNE